MILPTLSLILQKVSLSPSLSEYNIIILSAIPELSCSFEDTCSWTLNPLPGVHIGKWNIGEANSVGGGPHYDHTNQNGAGHYAYVSAEHHDTEYSYSMSVKAPASLEDICFTFWYHMYGGNYKMLSLMSVIGSNDIGNIHYESSLTILTTYYGR